MKRRNSDESYKSLGSISLESIESIKLKDNIIVKRRKKENSYDKDNSPSPNPLTWSKLFKKNMFFKKTNKLPEKNSNENQRDRGNSIISNLSSNAGSSQSLSSLSV